MRDRQAANVICHAGFVGEVRRIFRPAGDLLDILERAEHNVPDAGLHGRIRQLPAERRLDCLRRGDRRRHHKRAIRALEGRNEILLMAEFEGHGDDLSAEFFQTQSFRRILSARESTDAEALAFKKCRNDAASLFARCTGNRDQRLVVCTHGFRPSLSLAAGWIAGRLNARRAVGRCRWPMAGTFSSTGTTAVDRHNA